MEERSMKVEPVIQEGQFVRLEPMTMEHAPRLLVAAQHDDIWRYVSAPRPYTVAEMQKWMQTALDQQGQGFRIPFVTIDRTSDRVIGSTSYLDIQPANFNLEIGWTWLNPEFWRTPRNTEAKYLMLKHAFETLETIRVQIKTDSRNYISQNAIERIGGVKEGVLRRSMIYYNGYIRDTVYYSILDREWPEVKSKLEAKLKSYSPANN